MWYIFTMLQIDIFMKYKKMVTYLLVGFCAIITNPMQVLAQDASSEKLEVAAEFGKFQPIGVSVSSDNRLFVSFPKREPYVYGLTEIIDGKRVPFPNEEWNQKEGSEDRIFVNVQDLYVDTDDQLWVLDSKPASKNSVFGKDGSEEENLGKFKLLQIDLASNEVKNVFHFEDLPKDKSGLNDVRVDTDKQLAYLSDPGQAAIVILDLKTGKTRSVLKDRPMTQAVPGFSLSYEGKEMADAQGNIFKSNINGVALSKDNKYFYFRPINGLHLYRIATEHLANSNLSDDDLMGLVEDMGETVVSHGMAMDVDGYIYFTSSMDYSIKYLTPDGELKTLVTDERLIWPASIGVGTDGYLYISAAQVNRLPQWNGGVDKATYPYRVYRVKLDVSND